MKRPQGWPLLPIVALAWMFMEFAWFTGLGTCDYCGSDCYVCPTRAEIEQNLWNIGAYGFLYCDDCDPASRPNNNSVPASNQPIANGTANYWMNEGNRLYLNGSYKQAVTSYAEAVKLDPSLQDGWLNMGNALYFSGRYQESLDAYGAVLKLDPQNANALRGKSQAFLALNNTDKANTTIG